MEKESVAALADSREIAILVNQLHETERQLQKLTGGGVDSVIYPTGESHMLQDAQDQLRLSERQFREIFSAAATGIAVSTPQGRFLQVNEAFCRMVGYTERELLSQDFASLTHPEDLALNLAMRDELLAGQRDNFVIEKRYLKKNGDIQWVRTSVAAASTSDGEITTLIVIAEDIGERKVAELRLNRLNRLHTVLSKIAQAIIQTGNRRELFDAVCRIIAGDGLLRMVFIVEVDAAAGMARSAASYGAGLEYLREPTSVIPLMEGPLSISVDMVLRTGTYDVCNDIAAAPRMKPWREAAVKNGLLANASFPITLDGATVAVLVLYAGERQYFLDDEIGLMITAAKNLSYALEAQRKERALEESEGRYRALVNWSPESISVQREGKLVYVNPAAIKMMGAQSAEDLLGKPVLDLVHPDFREIVSERVMRSTNENGVLAMIEEKLIKLDGTTIDVEVQGTQIIYDGMPALYGSMRDITEQKRIESRFRRLLDSNIESVFFWNKKGEVTDSNDAFLHVVGYTREDLEAGNINWLAMTPPEYADVQERSFVELAATGICSTYEKEFIRKDGSRVPILLGAATFEDNPDEGVCFVIDLTERKRLEHQFLQVQKMEGIGTLAGGVAHDFSNILAIIQMQADFLIDEGGLSADQANSADDIVAAVKRGASLTRQLLLFTRREIFQPSDLDLNASIADTTRMLRRIVGEHVDVQLKMSSQPMFIQGDSGMLDQVLLNLVVNARDAMPNGGKLVIQTSDAELDELAASQSAHARVGSFVCLSVSDTGSGIPPEILPKIFDPFFTTKAIGKGTGLGLATVFGIAQQHRGWVNVNSEVGFGTTFRVYLPRLEKHVKSKPESFVPTVGHRGSETILLAEDDPLVRVSVQRVLSRLGYRVLVAPTGVEAMEVWQNRREEIRLLLTDLLMPDGMTGKDLAQRILEDDPQMKVIYMSGYSADIVGEDSPLTGGGNFLTKPFPAHKLSQAVRDCLDKKKTAQIPRRSDT
jgi:PAS domain S-box-containing protein